MTVNAWDEPVALLCSVSSAPFAVLTTPAFTPPATLLMALAMPFRVMLPEPTVTVSVLALLPLPSVKVSVLLPVAVPSFAEADAATRRAGIDFLHRGQGCHVHIIGAGLRGAAGGGGKRAAGANRWRCGC